MVGTIKFSQFLNGGDLANGVTTVGLGGGANTFYNNPWTYLASGSTGTRPLPSPSMYYRQRLNTDLRVYEYYDPISLTWVELSGSGTGTINPGVVNDLCFYPANGTTLSPLSSLANAVLITNSGSVPSLSTTLPNGLFIPGAIITASTAALTSGSVIAAPVAATDLTNKTYVDSKFSGGVTSITGTTNQIIASSATGAITLSLPQNIALGSTPTFGGLTLTSIPLPETSGGTGKSTYTTGDILYSSATNVLSKLAGNTSTVTQFLSQSGNGTISAAPAWATLPTAGLYAFFFYNLASDIPTYLQELNNPSTGGLQTLATAAVPTGTTLLANFATNTGSPSITFIPPGLVNLFIDADTTGGTKSYTLFAELYKRNLAGTETLLCTTGPTSILTGLQASYLADGTIPLGITLLTSDRLVTKVYALGQAGGSTGTINLFVEGTTASRLEIPAVSVNASNFVPYSGATQNLNLGAFAISGGTWQGNLVSGTYGGTGVNNGTSTMTIGGNFAMSGAHSFTGTISADTNVTFPTTGTLLTAAGAVTSLAATVNQTTVSGSVGAVTIGLASNLILPGTAGFTLPSGNTAARAGGAGTMRFNSQTNVFESTVDGIVWATIETSAIGVTSITGTANQVIASSATGAVTLSLPQNIATTSTPIFAGFNDSNGNPILSFSPVVASTTYLKIGNSISGGGINLFVGGSVTNCGINYETLGNGAHAFSSPNSGGVVATFSLNGGAGLHAFSFPTTGAYNYTFPALTGTVTALGNSTSGTGAFALVNTPTFVTPVLGAATATSINFGGSTLSTYVNAGSFTPTFTFATPGNLSVAYVFQIGTYYQIGNMVFFAITLKWTPTYTTSSGAALISSLPVSASAANNWIFSSLEALNLTYPAGTTQLMGMSSGGTTFNITAQGSATASVNLTTTQFVSGVQYQLDINGMYGV